MGLDLAYFEGQTPLDEDETDGILIPTIATRGELDEFEQQNIEQAIEWIYSRKLKPEKIFTEQFVRDLHKRMYGDVWSWAGRFRKTNKNIGVDKWQISMELKALLDDAMYWHKRNSFSPDEFAVRFKHRIVSIHCFPNGNGRHSRLMADIIIEKIYKQPVFSWGARSFINASQSRAKYLSAVKAADRGDYEQLLNFSRS